MKIGFSGHQNAPEQATDLLCLTVQEIIAAQPTSEGLTSLAAGADQVFAQEILKRGGTLNAVIPCDAYRRTFNSAKATSLYDTLLGQSSLVTHLPFPSPKEEAFLAAGIVVCERCDLLLALWDGEPAAGLGGTADIVSYAQSIGRNVRVIWPPNISR